MASVKRYLPESRHDIRFNDLVSAEVVRVVDETSKDRFAPSTSPDATTATALIAAYEGVTGTLRAVFATACFWADERHEPLLTRVVEDLSAHPIVGGNTFCHNLRHAKILPGMEQRRTPLSQWLQPRLRDSLKEVLPSDDRYERAFDRLGSLWGLVHSDLHFRPPTTSPSPFFSRAVPDASGIDWRGRRWPPSDLPIERTRSPGSSELGGELEDRRVREVHLQLDGQPGALIGARVEARISLAGGPADG